MSQTIPARTSVLASSGDSISSILGTSDPTVVEAFMRANGLSDSTIYAGEQYVMPSSADYAASTGELGQAALNQDNVRIVAQASSGASQRWGDYGLSTSGLAVGPQDLYTISPEFGMVGVGSDPGLQANYDFLHSNDPLMQSLLDTAMIDSVSINGTYLSNMPAMTTEPGISYEERNSLDPEAYAATAEIPKGGDNFSQLYNKAIGVHAVDATEYYVGQHNKTGNPLWAIPGSLAVLATPENADKTALTLGAAGMGAAVMTAYRTAGVLGVVEEGAFISAEMASGVPLQRRWDVDLDSNSLQSLQTATHSGKGRFSASTYASGNVDLPKKLDAFNLQLKNSGDTLVVGRKDINLQDIRILSAVNNVEFALLTRGKQRMIVRGVERSVEMPQPAYELGKQGWRWSGHAHPRGANQNTVDRNLLSAFRLGQEEAGVSVQGMHRVLNLNPAYDVLIPPARKF